MERYVEKPATLANTAGFVQSRIKGTFSWDVVKRMRDAWPGALVVIDHAQCSGREAEQDSGVQRAGSNGQDHVRSGGAERMINIGPTRSTQARPSSSL
ncbi:hypothetical protein [Bradyrhizobium sp. sBnM-33]|uniref:hypothetical protein n=1 Tax=Bradyrhizobium sp. sBnM-33 TaxID=2831780 RepID=UPI001BCF46D6|nr:hypothetical protein [Bradyrhizobium sp. sBnM-33]WOH53632.1 hypothetical protein RX328_17020 [Bradyrhizobium sp. sBnM-33]